MLAVFEHLKEPKELIKEWKKYNRLFYAIIVIAIIGSIAIYYISNLTLTILFLIILVSFPILFVFAKAVELSCLKRAVPVEKLSEGEWLYEDIIVGGKKIRANWEGVSADELRLIKKKYKKDVIVKEGIPFTPSFLLSFLCLLALFYRYRYWF